MLTFCTPIHLLYLFSFGAGFVCSYWLNSSRKKRSLPKEINDDVSAQVIVPETFTSTHPKLNGIKLVQTSQTNSKKCLKNILVPVNTNGWVLMAQHKTSNVSVFCPRTNLENGWISSKTFATIDLPVEAMVAAVHHQQVLERVFTTVEKRFLLHEFKNGSDSLISVEQLIIQLPFFSKRDMLLLITKEWISTDKFLMTQHSILDQENPFDLPIKNLVRMTVDYEGILFEREGNRTKYRMFERKCLQANIPGFILKQGVRQRLVEFDKLVNFARELSDESNIHI